MSDETRTNIDITNSEVDVGSKESEGKEEELKNKIRTPLEEELFDLSDEFTALEEKRNNGEDIFMEENSLIARRKLLFDKLLETSKESGKVDVPKEFENDLADYLEEVNMKEEKANDIQDDHRPSNSTYGRESERGSGGRDEGR